MNTGTCGLTGTLTSCLAEVLTPVLGGGCAPLDANMHACVPHVPPPGNPQGIHEALGAAKGGQLPNGDHLPSGGGETCAINSFAGDTPVLMADGTSKPIDQVKVGDKIQNAAPDSPTLETHTVTAIHVTDTDRDFVDLTIDTLAGPKTITTTTTTARHLFWDTTTHTWTNAQDLPTGNQLDTPGNGHATIQTSHHYNATLRTYNLTIDTLHTYYVEAGDTPVLVHNDDGGDDFNQAMNKALGGWCRTGA